ncbi:MAG: ribbon-helix-helix domain-containing protein [Acutalibacteraceae bacterium]
MAKTMFSARLEDEHIEKIKALSTELGINQAELIDKLLTVYELSESKNVLKGLETDITDFESHLQSLQSAFLHLLELNANADNRIRSEFRNMLDSKETIILDLQEQIRTTNEKIAEYEKRNDELMKSIEQLSNENQELKNKFKVCDEMIEDKNKSLSDKQIIIENLTEKVSEQSFMEQKIKDLELKFEKSENDIKQKDDMILMLNRKITDIEKHLDDEKKSYEYKIKVINQQSEIELKQAVLSEKEKNQKKYEEQSEKIFQLQEQLNILQRENFALKNKEKKN